MGYSRVSWKNKLKRKRQTEKLNGVLKTEMVREKIRERGVIGRGLRGDDLHGVPTEKDRKKEEEVNTLSRWEDN